jgi:polyhydroxyalkanoate synthesis regulator phasin
MSRDLKKSELSEEEKKKLISDIYREFREETRQLIENILKRTLIKISGVMESKLYSGYYTDKEINELSDYLYNKESEISRRLNEIYDKLDFLNEMMHSDNPRERIAGIWYSDRLRKEVYSLMVESCIFDSLYNKIAKGIKINPERELKYLRDVLERFSGGDIPLEEALERLEKITGQEIRSELRDIEYSILDGSFIEYLPERNKDLIKKILDNLGAGRNMPETKNYVPIIIISSFVSMVLGLILFTDISKTGMFTIGRLSFIKVLSIISLLFVFSLILFNVAKNKAKVLKNKNLKILA